MARSFVAADFNTLDWEPASREGRVIKTRRRKVVKRGVPDCWWHTILAIYTQQWPLVGLGVASLIWHRQRRTSRQTRLSGRGGDLCRRGAGGRRESHLDPGISPDASAILSPLFSADSSLGCRLHKCVAALELNQREEHKEKKFILYSASWLLFWHFWTARKNCCDEKICAALDVHVQGSARLFTLPPLVPVNLQLSGF